MYKQIAVSLMLISITAVSASAQAPGESVKAETRMKDQLEAIRQKNSLPALAGAIVTGSGIVDMAAVGVRKAGTDVPITADDQWHLGSDTKAMTAMAIGALVEQKKLNWDSTVEQVFPDLAAGFSPEVRKVTVVQLLSHYGGLPPNIDWSSKTLSGNLQEQRRTALKTAAAMKLLSAPGEKFNYSNLGYVLAGAIAEKAANASWEDLISEAIFKPLDMKSAGFGGVGTPGEIDQPWGHTEDGKPVWFNGPKSDNPPVMGPAGTVHCSIADWAKFIADQLRGERGEKALLKPETYKKLHAPPFGGNYALGWVVAERPWGGGTVLTHSGSNTMNFAVVWIAPQRDFAVLVCTNQGGAAAAKGCDEAAAALIGMHLKK